MRGVAHLIFVLTLCHLPLQFVHAQPNDTLNLPASTATDPGDVWQGLVMRSGFEPPVGKPISISAEGMTIEIGEGVTLRRAKVGLDRIAKPPTVLGSEFAKVAVIAEHAWRVRIRMERGDLVGAEPVLEELADALAKLPVAAEARVTSELVHRGLMKCRLVRGVHTGALDAYVQWRLAAETLLSEASEGSSSAGAGTLTIDDAAIDPTTRLATQLPPMWVNSAATIAFARAPTRVRAHFADGTASNNAQQSSQPSGAAIALARLYEAAARFEVGMPVDVPGGPSWDPLAPGAKDVGAAALGDEGVRLVREIVVAHVGDAEARAKSRGELQRRRSESIPAWQRSWIIAGIGRSLVRESGREDKLRGVAVLLEVPATLHDACPFVTGVAMAEAAMTLAELGDIEGATRIRSEFEAQFPRHAAIGVPALREIGNAQAASGSSGVGIEGSNGTPGEAGSHDASGPVKSTTSGADLVGP